MHGESDELGFSVARRRASTSTTSRRRFSTCSASTTNELTYRFQGRDYRLTDVHGTVVKPILA